MKIRHVFILALTSALIACGGQSKDQSQPKPQPQPQPKSQQPAPIKLSDSDKTLRQAFKNKQNDLQVTGQGKVKKLLADDTQGSQHQRFILGLASGQTLLIAHNIDLAARIDVLEINDVVSFYGEYEWNKNGGVIHWTHDDPAGKHINGWLLHNDIRYH